MPDARPSLAAPVLCPACGSTPRNGFTLQNGAPLLRCPTCRLGWWPWPAFDPAAFYDQDYFQSAAVSKGYNDYSSLEPGVRATARARLKRLASLLPPTVPPPSGDGGAAPHAPRPRLFEIGCGTGLFLDEARRAGWEVTGLEVSAYAAGVARSRGLEVQSAPAEEVPLPDGAYDALVLWDVIEHVRDPGALLQSAAAALRPGGVFALSTGDITSWCARLSGPRWHLFNLPEHLFFFSPESLRRLLRAADCEVLTCRYEVNWVPLSYIAERLRKMLRPRAPAAPTAPHAPALVLPATLFDVLGVYARRCG